MSGYYPEGGMMGSGIYAEDYTGDFYCSECDKEFELEGSTDDWGHNAYAECPECGKGLDKELPTREDYDADYREGK